LFIAAAAIIFAAAVPLQYDKDVSKVSETQQQALCYLSFNLIRAFVLPISCQNPHNTGKHRQDEWDSKDLQIFDCCRQDIDNVKE
jgi:hypothetical protein